MEEQDAASASLISTGFLALLVALLALVLPATALAGVAPDAVTGSAQAVSAAQEIVAGTVNPHGQTTLYHVEYAAATAQWCTTDETGGTPSQTTHVTLQYTDSNAHNVSVAVTGLTGGTIYCAELVAANGSGTARGGQIPFTAGLPVVTTSAADATGVQQATVQGSVDPAGQATTYSAVYDLASSSWCSSGGTTGSPTYQTAPLSLSYQDALSHNVPVNITGLQPATSYCAALAASNASSTAAGSQVIGTSFLSSFTTDTPVTTFLIQSTSATAAQLSGSVNPDGVSTAYYAVYGQVGTSWCQSSGASGAPAYQTSPQQTLLYQDQSAHNITVNITGLTTGTTYCVALRSQDTPLGVSSGAQVSFTAGLPTAITNDVAPDAPTTAELDGQVGPSGQSTTYYVIYDLQGSNWCLSGGTLGTASYSTAPQSLAQTDSGTYTVSVEMTGLTPGAQYCAALAADNGSNGQSGSPPQSAGLPFDLTAGLPPTAGTSSVLDQTGSQTAISGVVNAEGQSTTYQVAYDTSDSAWCAGGGGAPTYTTADQPVNPPDTNDHGVTVSLTGLQGGTTYCAAVVATNQSGSVTAPTDQFVAGIPTATAATTTQTSPTAETLTGTVSPTTQATNYYAAYDSANSYWCQNGGDPTTASFMTSQVALGGAIDNTAHGVSVALTGLTPGAGYCVELVAVNGSGTTPSSPLTFTAGFPFTVTTSNTDQLTDSSVTIDGTVNPAGLATSYWVAYDTQDSDWCSSGGQTASPGMATAPVSLAPVDSSDHDVTVGVTGLGPQTAYCAELIGQNETGTSDGAQVTFTTGALPVVSITAQSASGANQENISANLNPQSQPNTSYYAAYDLQTSAWCQTSGASGTPADTTTPVLLSASDDTDHPVGLTLTRLTPHTAYCTQVIATNAFGQATSTTVTFTAGVLSQLSIGTPSPTSPSTAAVTGTVNPAGQSTTYDAAYAPANSAFCLSGGATAQPSTTPPATLPFADANPHTVTVSLSGLKAGARYCAQILAQNASGAAGSALASFTTTSGPHLSGLHLAPAKFAAAKRGATTVPKPPKGDGTRVSYQDTQAGSVTLTVTQQRRGARNKHGACGKPTGRSNRRCTYTAIVGRFTDAAGAGDNRLVFTGRLGGRKLAPGSYELRAVAADRWQLSSATVTARFAIR